MIDKVHWLTANGNHFALSRGPPVPTSSSAVPPERVDAVRRFNRWYTGRVGALSGGVLATPFPLPQARVLWELAQRDGVSAATLCASLDIDSSYVSRLLATLERQGLILRARDRHDARRQSLALTASGRRAYDDLDRRSRDDVVAMLVRTGIGAGVQHLAPSSSLLALPESHRQAVRPGILLHGSFPVAGMREAQTYPLRIPYRLKAPVIRLEKLRAGDTIGFSRFYKVEADEWIATLPIGWADGYDSRAENGAKVLLGGHLCPVVNVNASHVNVSLGPATRVEVGDVAVLCGPDRPELTPEGFGTLVKGHNYLQINYKEAIVKRVHEEF